jgi:hypothetical protein
LLISCSEGLYCHHSATVDADRWPDDTALKDLRPKAVCTKCGLMGADVRPDWLRKSTRRADRVIACFMPTDLPDPRKRKPNEMDEALRSALLMALTVGLAIAAAMIIWSFFSPDG